MKRPTVAAPKAVHGHWPALQPHAETYALALQFQFQQSEWWSPERLLRQQLGQAQKLIRHAARTVPFYAHRLAETARLPTGRLIIEAFREIPVLTRKEIQDAGPALETTALPAGHGPTVSVQTSGSTGRPIKVKGSAVTRTYGHAFTMRSHLWHGRDLAATSVVIRPPRPGIEPGRRHRWAPLPETGPGLAIDARHSMEAIFEALLKADPIYLQCHPYMVLGMVLRSETTGRRPGRLREIRTYGEALEPWIRERCRAVWGVEIADSYSAEEFGHIAHQCPEAEGLHVMAESVLVEVLDDEGWPCAEGETGRVVVTGLQNFATPLIRAELGDVATVGGPCVCGRGLPVLARVLGRVTQFLRYPSGETQFPDVLLHSLTPEVPIRQYQLVQRTLDDILVNLVVARPLAAAEERIRETLIERLRHPFNFEFVYLDEIPRAPSGKFEFFRSELVDRT